MSKKLREKAAMIGAQKPVTEPAPVQVSDQPAAADSLPSTLRARTAPGVMFDFMAAQSGAIQETAGLRDRLAEFDGSSPSRKLDPQLIRPSRWANRHATSLMGTDFDELKSEILAAQGNVQPIKVRPLAVDGEGVGRSYPPAADSPRMYEIVYGHRRHAACKALGLPVLAFIEEVSDEQLFIDMERENRQRKDLSAWEQGAMYARALDGGLFASNRRLADSIGRDLADVGKALSLARLPPAVVEAFRSPSHLQFRWAKPLNDALQKDPEGLIKRAMTLKGKTANLSAKEIFEKLVVHGAGGRTVLPPKDLTIRAGRKKVAVLTCDNAGRTHVRIEEELDDVRRGELAKLLETFFSRAPDQP